MFEIGINTNNECGKDINEILNNIKKNGFNNVMIAARGENFEEAIKKALDLGLKVPYIHLDNSYSDDLWVVGEANDKYVQSVIDQIKLCGKYNIPIAVMHATIGDPAKVIIKPNKNAISSMLKILDVAKDMKVKIAIENIDTLNFQHFQYLLDNIKSEWLGFCYDVGHHHLYNPKFDIVKKYGSRLIAIHLHDNLMDWKYGLDWTRDMHYLPFDGKIDFEKVCEKLAKTNYANVVMLEVHKRSASKPIIYKDKSVDEFLSEAYKRGLKLKDLIEEYKK